MWESKQGGEHENDIPVPLSIDHFNHVISLYRSVWPDLAKFCHFGNILNVIRQLLVFGQILNLPRHRFYAIGQILNLETAKPYLNIEKM